VVESPPSPKGGVRYYEFLLCPLWGLGGLSSSNPQKNLDNSLSHNRTVSTKRNETGPMDKLNEIANALANIDDPQLIENFLKSILTDNEARDISSRWELVKLLDQGMSQRKIADKLKLSLCKITRGSKELKKENSAFKKVIRDYLD
jgi:TrpR family trp operon transcriptional repressor